MTAQSLRHNAAVLARACPQASIQAFRRGLCLAAIERMHAVWVWFAFPAQKRSLWRCQVRLLLSVSVAAVLTAFVSVSAIADAGSSVTIVGTVTLMAADGGTFTGSGVRVVLACRAHMTKATEIADEHGAFRFLNVPADTCSVQADVQGFVAQPVMVVTIAGQVATTEPSRTALLRVGVTVG